MSTKGTLTEALPYSTAQYWTSTDVLPYSTAEYCVLAACSAVAWVFVIELNLTIFFTFKRYRGLYFWSLLVTSWGCALHGVGFILKFAVDTSWITPIPFIEIGWVGMVTGQALVLYSRLHLVLRDQRIMRCVLWMIIFCFFTLHIPTIVFTVGSNSPNATAWIGKFNIMERIQLTGFCIQETIISSTYLWATTRILQFISHRKSRKVMWQLVLINAACIGMDVILICLEYTNEYVGEASIKPMLYAIKLKLEFAVLNQLVGLVQAGHDSNRWPNNRSGAGNGVPLSANGPAWHSDRIANSQAVVSANTKETPSQLQSPTSPFDPSEIYRTQQVDVSSEPASSTGANSHFASSPTSVTFKERTVASLMGTTKMSVPIHGKRSRSESETEINRDSIELDKDGMASRKDSSDGVC
ncbi:hypothetical protein MMC13_001602 [Lambiella insularis]|nr:hypothetical protein [Lambiella insularis]